MYLSEQEIQDLENFENLHNFLEEKICTVLNFSKDREYFLRYALANNRSSYHCVLLDKEMLAGYVDDAAEYLSHPCFLCSLEKGYVLIKDGYLNWAFVGFNKKNIVDFCILENLEKIFEKLEFLGLNTFWLWAVEGMTLCEEEFLKKLEAKFSIHRMAEGLENIELPESCNFNPLEKSLPFSKTQLGFSFLCLTGGIILGVVLWIILAFVELLEQRKNVELKTQISTLQDRSEMFAKNHTEAYGMLISLQSKLETLQETYKTNAEFLKDFEKSDLQAVQLISVLNPYLEQLNVKIAYFELEKENFSLLLFGDNALRILEAIEKESLGKVEEMSVYGAFVWGIIRQ